jgi:hypothetical protein
MRCNDQLVNAGMSRVGQFEATRLAGYRVFDSCIATLGSSMFSGAMTSSTRVADNVLLA